MIETAISVVSSKALLTLFGACDQHLRAIRNALGVQVCARDGRIHIEGDEQGVARATEVLEQLQAHANRHGELADEDVSRVLASVIDGAAQPEAAPVEVFRPGLKIRPRTAGQARYMEAIRRHDIVMCTICIS